MESDPPLSRPRWWQWPTVLSLDAPAVVLLWQGLIAHAAGVPLGPAPRFVLGASVWLSYAGDRWIEGWRLAPAQVLTVRHSFYQRRRWSIAGVGTVVLGMDLAVAERYLPPADLIAGVVLLGAVLAYLLSHQVIHRRSPWRVPKEACVALLLTAGVALFILAGRPSLLPTVAAPLGLFAGLCLANCALIYLWEREVDRGHGQVSLIRQFRGAAKLSHALPWAVGFVAALHGLVGPEASRPIAGCDVVSSVCLAQVDRLEGRWGWRAARVLADVALLTPAGLLFLSAIRPS